MESYQKRKMLEKCGERIQVNLFNDEVNQNGKYV